MGGEELRESTITGEVGASVCPKKNGGLRLRMCGVWNKALLGK